MDCPLFVFLSSLPWLVLLHYLRILTHFSWIFSHCRSFIIMYTLRSEALATTPSPFRLLS